MKAEFFDRPASDGIKRKPMTHGVFVWAADAGSYRLATVYGRSPHVRGAGVCTFTSERNAQAKADRLNADPEHYGRTGGRGFVVRSI
jgi:hypothetical protein